MAQQVQPARVLHVSQLSPLVRELVLAPREPVQFSPGQWVSVKLPVGPRPPLTRAYSLACSPSLDGHLVLAFDRVPDGAGSSYLWTVKEGDELTISGPYGRFTLPDNPSHLVFLARYTGIVPVRCMIMSLAGDSPPITVFYSAPELAEAIYHAEFQALAERRDGVFRYSLIIEANRPEEEARHQAVVQELDRRLDEVPDATILVAGIKAFVKPIRAYLAGRGMERGRVRYETYD